MRALRLVAWGVLLIVIDVRVDGLDLAPDLLGWGLAGYAVVGLRAHSAWFGRAGIVCIAGALSALFDLQQAADPMSWVWLVGTVALTAFVWCSCSGIREALPGTPSARTADTIRWWNLGLSVAAYPLGWVLSETDLAVVALLAVLIALVVFVCFVLLLFRTARVAAPVAVA
ncbi:membrane hypothetical protein [metagenome]|uniref:DUF308 domain-containing protein n=1 Tax=metagenome TaxID=256318 RepID=A0A2P2C0M6_9ZZZZ